MPSAAHLIINWEASKKQPVHETMKKGRKAGGPIMSAIKGEYLKAIFFAYPSLKATAGAGFGGIITSRTGNIPFRLLDFVRFSNGWPPDDCLLITSDKQQISEPCIRCTEFLSIFHNAPTYAVLLLAAATTPLMRAAACTRPASHRRMDGGYVSDRYRR